MSAYVLHYVDIMDKNDVEWYLLVPWIELNWFELISKFKMAAITAISLLQTEKLHSSSSWAAQNNPFLEMITYLCSFIGLELPLEILAGKDDCLGLPWDSEIWRFGQNSDFLLFSICMKHAQYAHEMKDNLMLNLSDLWENI